MAYDEDLAHRVREQLAGEAGVSEKAMFGGLAFLLHGHMTVSVAGRGGLMLRVGPSAAQDALARAHTEQVEMRGRPMPGWIRIAPEGVKTNRQLSAWVHRGVEFARTLPPKG
ncbi:MAG: TfoX/Sxy family protein [Solirubrobacteraceae bacterium]